MNPRQALRRLRRRLRALPGTLLASHLPPGWSGYRWVAGETVEEYFQRHAASGRESGGSYRILHPETVVANPLPGNIADRRQLPAERSWWGYSFFDVPARTSQQTFITTLPDCQVVGYLDTVDDFHVAVLNRDRRALRLREVTFRTGHGRVLRSARTTPRLARATWILERVYHNHSHWLTAHLPKLCLLRESGGLEHVVLPARRSAALDASLAMLGLDARDFPQFEPVQTLAVEELTLLGTDRFRPELLRPVRTALVGEGGVPRRRIYISRRHARRRRLCNEVQIWPLFRAAGFERVCMEDLAFPQQVALMAETAMLAAPHGAGLTNMLCCPAGCEVLEIADLSFPNPNFYALAAAMGHRYWLVGAGAVGEGHPLERDMRVDPAHVTDVLQNMLARAGEALA